VQHVYGSSLFPRAYSLPLDRLTRCLILSSFLGQKGFFFTHPDSRQLLSPPFSKVLLSLLSGVLLNCMFSSVYNLPVLFSFISESTTSSYFVFVVWPIPKLVFFVLLSFAHAKTNSRIRGREYVFAYKQKEYTRILPTKSAVL